MTDRLLTPIEAARTLGIARATIYEWAALRRIESVHLGKALRFRESAIQKLIRESIVPPLREASR